MFTKEIINRVFVRGLTVAAVTLMLSACSGLGEGDITDAINQVIKDKKTCYSLQDNHVTWPIRVQRQDGAFSRKPLDPILAAMQSAGYLKITQETQQRGMFPVLVDVILPTEEAKGWWDVKNGYCFGTREVVEIQEWTEPGKESGQPVAVKFTWHLNAPSWANRLEFKNIEGLGEPVSGEAALQKTNKGWRATIY